jgi:hypothetical protein
MIVHDVPILSELGQPHFRYLMSDLHFGSGASDHERIASDCQRAVDSGARILINGDVFDAIGPKDKRFSANVLHPTLHGKKDLEAAIVDLAFGVLKPFAPHIDVMGIGNHEEAWIQYNHGDPVARLIEKLNGVKGARIKHGSFWGYINTRFAVGRETAIHKLLYYHGTGGDSPVTKGTIDFNRKGRNWIYDALTFGHKHNIAITGEQIMDVTEAGRVVERLQLNLQTGSYYRNYRQIETDGDPLDYHYAASKAHPPKPIGGIFLIMRPTRVNGALVVRQDYASDIIQPWPVAKHAEAAGRHADAKRRRAG